MLRAILNKSWRQHPTRRQLYGHLPPITKTIQVRRARHAGHCWRSKDELVSDVLLWTPHMSKQKQDDQPELTYSSYVRTQDETEKTCRRRWTIGKSGGRWSRISVLAARLDDDDELFLIFTQWSSFKYGIEAKMLGSDIVVSPLEFHFTFRLILLGKKWIP